MSVPLERLEGRKFCVVFVKVLDAASERVQLQCMRGRASVDRGRVSCVDENGNAFQIPSISIRNILPSDGTALLKDAEYFCMVRLDDSIQLVNKDVDEVFLNDGCDCGHDHCCHDHGDHDGGHCCCGDH